MKFAKIIFWIAAIWGILVLTPLYFLFDTIGRQDPPPITHPGFYYGFVGVRAGVATSLLRYRQRSAPFPHDDASLGARKIQLRDRDRSCSTCNTIRLTYPSGSSLSDCVQSRVSRREIISSGIASSFSNLGQDAVAGLNPLSPESAYANSADRHSFEVPLNAAGLAARASLNHPRLPRNRMKRQTTARRRISQDNPAQRLPPAIHLQNSRHADRQSQISHHRHALPSLRRRRRRDRRHGSRTWTKSESRRP